MRTGCCRIWRLRCCREPRMGVRALGCQEWGPSVWEYSGPRMRVPEQWGLQGFVIMGWIPGMGMPGVWVSSGNHGPQGKGGPKGWNCQTEGLWEWKSCIRATTGRDKKRLEVAAVRTHPGDPSPGWGQPCQPPLPSVGHCDLCDLSAPFQGTATSFCG